jgi:hypothetical protein
VPTADQSLSLLQKSDGDIEASTRGNIYTYFTSHMILIIAGALKETAPTTNSCGEDADSIYFPPVLELISSTLPKDQLPAPQSVANLGDSHSGYSSFFFVVDLALTTIYR